MTFHEFFDMMQKKIRIIIDLNAVDLGLNSPASFISKFFIKDNSSVNFWTEFSSFLVNILKWSLQNFEKSSKLVQRLSKNEENLVQKSMDHKTRAITYRLSVSKVGEFGLNMQNKTFSVVVVFLVQYLSCVMEIISAATF